MCMSREDVPRLLKVSMPVAWAAPYCTYHHDFLAQYPERLDLRLSDGLANLVEEELDVVIRIGNLERSGANLILRKIASHASSAAVQRISQYAKPKHPDELAHHNCLLFTYSMGYDIWRFKRDTEFALLR